MTQAVSNLISESRLNLASGSIRINGFFNIDRVMAENVDAVVNLEDFPWPIESESAEMIICNHYVEHIPHDSYSRRLVRMIDEARDFEHLKKLVALIDTAALSDGLILFMEEVYRILKPEGTIQFITPYYQGEVAWSDPTHQRAITETTFRYFNREWRCVSGLEHYNINCNFDIELGGYDLFSNVRHPSPEEKKFAMRHINNVIFAMHTTLTKR